MALIRVNKDNTFVPTSMPAVSTNTLAGNATITSLNLDVSDGAVYGIGWKAPSDSTPEGEWVLSAIFGGNTVLHGDSSWSVVNGKINHGSISSSDSYVVKLFKVQ